MNLNYLRQAVVIARTEFLLRDQGTFLGFFWTLINPLLLFLSLFGVFFNKAENAPASYAVYLLTGILIWNFFSNTTSTLGLIILTRGQYLHSSTIKLTTLMTASLLVQTAISILEGMIGFLLLYLFFGAPFSNLFLFVLSILLTTPLALLLGVVLVWFQSKLNDTSRLWGLALRIGFFLTPIFYYKPQNPILGSLQSYNPIVPALSFARGEIQFLTVIPQTLLLLILAVCALLITERNRAKLVELQ
jgi:ABC-2 type transport system permease protein